MALLEMEAFDRFGFDRPVSNLPPLVRSLQKQIIERVQVNEIRFIYMVFGNL